MQPQGKKGWADLLGLVGIGWYIAACIVLGVLGGVWLDGKLNSRPLLTIIGLFLGIIIAFYGVYRMLLPYLKDNNGYNKKGKP
jgi:ATP synthase protein I